MSSYWRSPNTELPELCKEVVLLVVRDEGDLAHPAIGWRDTSGEYRASSVRNHPLTSERVLGWMPLPEDSTVHSGSPKAPVRIRCPDQLKVTTRADPEPRLALAVVISWLCVLVMILVLLPWQLQVGIGIAGLITLALVDWPKPKP